MKRDFCTDAEFAAMERAYLDEPNTDPVCDVCGESCGRLIATRDGTAYLCSPTCARSFVGGHPSREGSDEIVFG